MTGNLLSRAHRVAALFGVLILPIHPAFAGTVEAQSRAHLEILACGE